ncbi:nucleolar protein involved in rRNA processing, putative [Candida dubliniensis CD36]|uniref:Pescadillo homolog n=1 Tax=Candida dubliniensis (strain CD36 / ATCC MYA-646 / CBS 7987 / NCPF 3949 / NRRL Y-17841) TaxID=573826 RepID=B9WCK1_CANDC|nr:nucleolar protein involved in rRNA processing, putative [Candida dubliniensis CD36]CAX44124.1 nucleolar protein involved in rRNA processing, putative [Candida dubliniensis CD36]
MARIKKRGTTGNAKNFITRTQAIKKLQISLADFRRLCIFKGIYPREPRNKKKANKGSTAPVTFYYSKDIQYLLHEPVLDKFRQHKTFAKKLQKALGRGEVSDAYKLDQHRPKYTLNHIIKERYPTFADALRDLDDPLNMLFLFANMPATDKVSAKVVSEAEKLCNQWLAYVAKERCLKKVFVSIKGVYYQATVKGQEIRWLIPYKFPTNIPTDVDFRIMLTFLEFYSTLVHFVLYKLYNEAGLVYPPIIEKSVGLSGYVLQAKDAPLKKKEEKNDEEGKNLSKIELNKAIKADEEQQESDEQDNNNGESVEDVELDEFKSTKEDSLLQPSKYASSTAELFSKFIFYIGREVPLDILEFCILSCGGKIISEIAIDDLKINDPEAYKKLDFSNITHQIIDRPKILQKVPGRTYVQPQWVFDSINKQELINVNEYAAGETLPPHLSPWGDAGGYDPNKEVEKEGGEAEEDTDEEEEEEVEIEDGDEDQEDEDEEEDEDLKAQKELELEAAGVKFSEINEEDKKSHSKKSKGTSKKEVDEEKELKKIMMSNKQKKLFKKMQYGIEKKETREKELTKKKKQLNKKKEQLKKLN